MTVFDKQYVDELFEMAKRLIELLPSNADPKHAEILKGIIKARETESEFDEFESLLDTLDYCRNNIKLEEKENVLFDDFYILNSAILARGKKLQEPRKQLH